MTREEKKQAKIDAKLKKEQAKAEAIELKKQKKLERKNNSFFKKLRAKIESLFESEKLTFAGKIFMVGIYGTVLSTGGIIIVSAVRSVLNFFMFLVHPTTPTPEILAGASGVLWILFFISFVVSGIIGVSLLEKEED